jgi:hypothetical protein
VLFSRPPMCPLHFIDHCFGGVTTGSLTSAPAAAGALQGAAPRGSLGSIASAADEGLGIGSEGVGLDGMTGHSVGHIHQTAAQPTRHGSSSYHLLSSLASINPMGAGTTAGDRGWITGSNALGEDDYRWVA